MQVFGLAFVSHNGIVSFLEPPTDHERAEKVIIPMGVVLVIRGIEYPLIYSHPNAEHLLLEGRLQADLLSVLLRKVDPSTFLLVSRGFHWINEFSFNR